MTMRRTRLFLASCVAVFAIAYFTVASILWKLHELLVSEEPPSLDTIIEHVPGRNRP